MTNSEMADFIAEALRNDEPVDNRFEVPAELTALLDTYALASAQAKEAEEAKKIARDRLVEIAQAHDASVLTRDGRPVATVNMSIKNQLDTKKLKAERPDVYDAFTRTVQVVTFRLQG